MIFLNHIAKYFLAGIVVLVCSCDKKATTHGNGTVTVVAGPGREDGILNTQSSDISPRGIIPLQNSNLYPEPLGSNFNPVGRPVGDITLSFGKPTRETPSVIAYEWSGLTLEFGIKDGNVASMQRRLGAVPLRIDSLISDRNMHTASSKIHHMEAWLSYWNIISCTPESLKNSLGKPDLETGKLLIYRFRTPFSGTDYIFDLSGGKVAFVRRTG